MLSTAHHAHDHIYSNGKTNIRMQIIRCSLCTVPPLLTTHFTTFVFIYNREEAMRKKTKKMCNDLPILMRRGDKPGGSILSHTPMCAFIDSICVALGFSIYTLAVYSPPRPLSLWDDLTPEGIHPLSGSGLTGSASLRDVSHPEIELFNRVTLSNDQTF